MSKELTPLQALEKITNYKCSCMSEKIKCKEIIETALEELEVKREVIGDILSGDDDKKLKTLEIIKKKGVAAGMLQLECVGLEEYNNFIGDKKLYLTQEEYDLLKEVLL